MTSHAEKTEKIASARAEFLAGLHRVFSSADGAAILAWLHATAATRKPAFMPGAAGAAIDPIAAAVRDGRKSIVWEIEANLEQARSAHPADKPPTSPGTGARRKGR